MATVSHALRQVKAQLHQLLPDQQILRLCRDAGHVWRRRVLDPSATVHLLLLQLLARVALDGLRHVARVNVTAAAICKARRRLPVAVFVRLVERCARVLRRDDDGGGGGGGGGYKGLAIRLVDGMSFMTPDTPQLARRYGKASNQRGVGGGYPTPKLLALVDFATGLITRVIALPAARQELTCLTRLFAAAAAAGGAALLLGDRGLVGFAQLVLMTRAAVHGCFRLPRWQVVHGRGGGARRRLARLGRQDLLVRWTAGRRPGWMSRRRWDALGLAGTRLTLRQVSFRIRPGKGFRTRWAWLVTTLLDPRQYPARELVELYGKRWQVEVCFRDLKRTLGMDLISARTVDGARKEVLAFVLLYNLVRDLMRRAATAQGTTPDRVSFTDALQWLLWSDPGDALPPRLRTNPRRTRHGYARRVKRGRHRYPQLRQTRQQSAKPPCSITL